MILRFASLPMVLLFLSPRAGAQVTLAWKLKTGDRFFAEEVTHVRQTIKIMGTENRQDLDQTRVMRFTVVKKTADNSLILEQKIEAVKVKVSGDGPDADTKILKQFEGASFQITIDPHGKVTRLDGYDLFLKQIAKADVANAKLVRALMTEESLKVSAETLFGFVPQKEVARGESWQTKTALPLGPLGSLALQNTYTFLDIQKATQVAKLEVAGKATYVPPRAVADPPLKIAGGDLRLRNVAGTILFDLAAGRLKRSETKHVLEGTLRITIREATVEMNFHQEQDRTVRVLPKKPLEK